MRKILAAVALAGALVVTGCSSAPTPTPAAPVPAQEQPSGEDVSEAPVGDAQMAPATRDNPAPAGSSVKMGAYDVSLGVTVLDATADVLAENQFNSPPEDGHVFVMVPVTATLEGAASGRAGADLAVQFVGSDAITYSPGCDLNYVPDALSGVGEMYSGATATGNVCASVPTGVVDTGTWVVMESVSFDGARAFFALD